MTWWESDARYGQKGWTLIHPSDGGHAYFVKAQPRKRRGAPRALRFADLKPGAVLLQRNKSTTSWHVKPTAGFEPLNDNQRVEIRHQARFWICEFRWFDPVKGQIDLVAGEMAGVCPISNSGKHTSASAHTLRGLASQGFNYATSDQTDQVLAFIDNRAVIIADFDEGRITPEEARLRALPYRNIVRGLLDLTND